MSDIETLQSELRIQSVENSNRMAKTKKGIQSILNYELSIVIDMLENSESADRILPLAKDIAKKLSDIKQN